MDTGTEEKRPHARPGATVLDSRRFRGPNRKPFAVLSKARPGSLTSGPALVAASFAVATFTLVLPSMPSYDAWVWAIWGRDIVALDVDPRTTPGWKPLPVAFATLLAPLGDAAPHLWIVIARAGGVLALVFAYRLAARLAGPLAGAVSAAALALTSGWFIYLGHGLADPLAVALVLWAIECHLDGRSGRAFALALGAALIRPEIAPFLAAYAAFVWLRRPDRRLLFAATGLVVLPVAWIGPAWWSARDLFRGKRMHGPFRPPPEESPTLVVLDRFQELILLPIALAAVVAVVLAVRQRDRVVIALGLLFAAWVGLVAAMAERGFTGNPRYLLPAAALLGVLGGVGVARGLALFRLRWRPAVALAVAIAAAPLLAPRIADLRGQAEFVDGRVEIQEELVAAIERAGGADAVRACLPVAAPESTPCGRPAVNTTLGPRLAWELGVPLQEVTSTPEPPGLVFRAPEGAVSGVPPTLEAGVRVREIATAGDWDVLAVTRP